MGEVVARAVVWAVHKSVCGSRRSISIAVSQKLPPLPFKNSVAWNPPVTLSWCVRNPRPHLPPPPRRSDCGCCTPARLFKQGSGHQPGTSRCAQLPPNPTAVDFTVFPAQQYNSDAQLREIYFNHAYVDSNWNIYLSYFSQTCWFHLREHFISR